MDLWSFVWNCMDSSMILVQKLLGYGLLGFFLEISFVPFLGFR